MKLCFKNQWVTEEIAWVAMLEDRNRTSHTYDEVLAAAVYSRLPNYIPLFQSLIEQIKQTHLTSLIKKSNPSRNHKKSATPVGPAKAATATPTLTNR